MSATEVVKVRREIDELNGKLMEWRSRADVGETLALTCAEAVEYRLKLLGHRLRDAGVRP